MPSKSKREAAEALDKLATWARRDGVAKPLVAKVQRYVGELRQEMSQLKATLEVRSNAVTSLAVKKNEAADEIKGLKDELQRERSALRQSESERKATQARLEELAAQLEPPEGPDPEPEIFERVERFKKLFRSIKKKMKHPPRLEQDNHSIDVAEFNYDPTLIGEWVLMSTMTNAGFLSYFDGGGTTDMAGKLDKDTGVAYAKWIREWFRNLNEWEQQLSTGVVFGKSPDLEPVVDLPFEPIGEDSGHEL